MTGSSASRIGDKMPPEWFKSRYRLTVADYSVIVQTKCPELDGGEHGVLVQGLPATAEP